MTILRVGHIGLTVSDLERSKRFYSELFGFEEFFSIRRRETPWLDAQVGYKGADIEFCHMRGAGLHLELLKYHHPSSSLPLPDDSYIPGAVHFNLWVDDIEELTAKIRSYIDLMPKPGRARFASQPLFVDETTITDGPQTGGKGYYMRDPDGHTIEVWQPAPTQAAQGFGR